MIHFDYVTWQMLTNLVLPEELGACLDQIWEISLVTISRSWHEFGGHKTHKIVEESVCIIEAEFSGLPSSRVVSEGNAKRHRSTSSPQFFDKQEDFRLALLLRKCLEHFVVTRVHYSQHLLVTSSVDERTNTEFNHAVARYGQSKIRSDEHEKPEL